LWGIDGLGRGLLVDVLGDDTDDTKSSIPDIKRIPMRDKVVGEERPAPVYDLFLDVSLLILLVRSSREPRRHEKPGTEHGRRRS